jgi:ribosomal protein S27E
MNRQLRRGAVSKALLVFLGLAAVAAGAFWLLRGDKQTVSDGAEYPVWCTTCGEVKVRSGEIEYKGTAVLCPKCGQYDASFKKPSGSSGGLETP